MEIPLSKAPTIRMALALCALSLLVFLGFLVVRGRHGPVSSRDIPLPFGGGRSSALRGQVTDVGETRDGRPIVDMTFDAGEVSETFGSGALTFVLTPADSSSFSSGALLSDALTHGKRLYGYKYTSRDATQERAMQDLKDGNPVDANGNPISYTYSELFPGTFFAADVDLHDPSSFVSSFHALHPDVTFRPLSQVTLEPNARYLIIAEESGVTITVRGLTLPPDITFTSLGSVPWQAETFAIPQTSYNTDDDSGFFAYVGADMLKLTSNLLAAIRVRPAPLAPVNYWWYPIVGPQQTAFGVPVFYNSAYQPCTNDLGSMHKCAPGETPTGTVAINGVYAWNQNIGAGQWQVTSDNSPPSNAFGNYPALLSNLGMLRIRGKLIERWGADRTWRTIGTLPDTAGAIVSHERGTMYALSPDGRHMYRSTDDAAHWQTLTVAGIDFPVGKLSFLSKNGHLWVVGRHAGDTRDQIVVWPPFSPQPDPGYYITVLSENTDNLDASTCNYVVDGHRWHLPSQSEFALLAPSLRGLYGSLTNPFFRVQETSDLFSPVKSMLAPDNDPVESSNSDNLLCIADASPSDVKPIPDHPGCTISREPTASSGGVIRFLPPDGQIAIRIEDSCISNQWGRVNSLVPNCTGQYCQLRKMSCVDGSPVTNLTDCPSLCKDGVCLAP